MALLIIYTLLAVPLKSYAQPLMIMAVIPFGIIGSLLGHMIFGLNLSMLSLFGIIAVAGVVVNDSLIMVDYINTARAQGVNIRAAVVEAGGRRFRAILLTSLTTFIGLLPIMSETSLQAKNGYSYGGLISIWGDVCDTGDAVADSVFVSRD